MDPDNSCPFLAEWRDAIYHLQPFVSSAWRNPHQTKNVDDCLNLDLKNPEINNSKLYFVPDCSVLISVQQKIEKGMEKQSWMIQIITPLSKEEITVQGTAFWWL